MRIAWVIAFAVLAGGCGSEQPASTSRQQSKPSGWSYDGPAITASPGVTGEEPGIVEGVVRSYPNLEPRAGVQVFAVGAGQEHTVETDAAGRFLLSLDPGQYSFQVRGPRYWLSAPRWLAVAPGAKIDIPVRVVLAPQLRLLALGATGRPLAGATVDFEIFGDETHTRMERVAVVDERGGVLLELPPGRVHFWLTTKDGAVVNARSKLAAGVFASPMALGIGAYRASGSVVDPAGNSVQGAQVTIRGAVSEWRVAADDKGMFELEGLDERVAILATAPGYGPSKPSTVALRRTIASNLTPPLVVRLTQSQRIGGVVVDDRGAPLAGAVVTAAIPNGLEPPAEATTGPDGRFELTNTGKGPYRLTAVADGFSPTRMEDLTGPNVALRVPVRHPGALSGTVTADGSPVKAFTLRLIGHTPPGEAYRRVDPRVHHFATVDGQYRIEKLAPGRHELAIWAEGYAPRRLSVDVPASGVGEGSATLSSGATITGRVVASGTGDRLDGHVLMQLPGGEVVAHVTDGSFTIPHVPEGKWFVRSVIRGYVQVHEPVSIAGDRAELELKLARLDPGQVGKTSIVGIGAVLEARTGSMRITRVHPSSPAEQAGLQVDDDILAIDGFPVGDQSFELNVLAIRGVAGSSVTLTIRRGAKVFDVSVVRREVKF